MTNEVEWEITAADLSDVSTLMTVINLTNDARMVLP